MLINIHQFSPYIMENPNQKDRDLRPALVALTGDLIAVPIPLERTEVILGRALEADVRINDLQVSRQHAQINTIPESADEPEQYIIKDLHSRNGTFLNGRKIVQEVLHKGDKITLGDQIFRFDLMDEIDREYQRQVRRLLSHDDLTGLLSSRSFFSELRLEAARAQVEGRRFCVLMMDIDYFKLVNDTYGHLTGSKTLEEIGLCITQLLRTGDVAARFGGEEFAAFLLNAELAQGMVAAERIRWDIEHTGFTIARKAEPSETHNLTISIGVSCFPEDSTDPIELVEMADSALYRAKRSGRNRVCAYKEIDPEELNKPLPSSPR